MKNHATNLPKIKTIGFGERPSDEYEPYNASEIVPIDDSRFLFCDNNIGDGLFELRLTPEGRMGSALIKRSIQGLLEFGVDDLEALALVEVNGRRFIVASPSMSLKLRKRYKERKKTKRGKEAPSRNGLIRIEIDSDYALRAEIIPDFRSWLINNSPELERAPRLIPDDGGLNIEGLGWNPETNELLFGVRTPVVKHRPIILRVSVGDIAGPWVLENFKMLPPIILQTDTTDDEQGVRSIEFDPSRKAFLVVVGNSTSKSKAPFSLYSWDGDAAGTLDRFSDIRFHKKMRVEGVTHGTIGGRGAIIFVDDRGGYQVIWDDDVRLRRSAPGDYQEIPEAMNDAHLN